MKQPWRQGVRKVSSVSREGVSLVTAEFAWGTDMDFAVLNLREKHGNVNRVIKKCRFGVK